MEFTLLAKTESKCKTFLKIKYKEGIYLLEDFAKKYKQGDFSLDLKLKECSVIYRDKEIKYSELCQSEYNFCEALKISDIYANMLQRQEPSLLLNNQDYYKASKFIFKLEECLQNARYYLIHSSRILSTDFEANWEAGYIGQFKIRTINCTTAISWYNNCMDYILLVIYFAFGMYKCTPNYSLTLSHEQLLKQCTYNAVGKIYSEHKGEQNFKSLWSIVTECYTALREVNDWANYIKHKGGIDFVGLKPEQPFKMTVTDNEGKIIAKNDEFDIVKIDLDETIDKLCVAHQAIVQCIEKLVEFIDFQTADPKIILTPIITSNEEKIISHIKEKAGIIKQLSEEEINNVCTALKKLKN